MAVHYYRTRGAAGARGATGPTGASGSGSQSFSISGGPTDVPQSGAGPVRIIGNIEGTGAGIGWQSSRAGRINAFKAWGYRDAAGSAAPLKFHIAKSVTAVGSVTIHTTQQSWCSNYITGTIATVGAGTYIVVYADTLATVGYSSCGVCVEGVYN